MYGDTERGEAATALRFVTCDLSSLSDCGCLTSSDSELVGSSTKRKTRSNGSHIDPDSFTTLSVKRLVLGRPSLIDRLISRNKSALEAMEGKRRGPGRPSLSSKNKDTKETMKRKRTESMNGTSPAVKRLRSNKEGSESDSSESRNTSLERRGRPPLDKAGDKKSPKKTSRKIERRCSVRIHHSLLRSGKKRNESALKQRRIRHLAKDPKSKKKWNGHDKTDSNSNVFLENDSNDEVGDSTDSEISRGASESSDLTLDNKKVGSKQNSPDEDIKKKRKRRKRDSMWVRKVKKQMKVKVENAESFHYSSPLTERKRSITEDDIEEGAISIAKTLETSDIPVLDKESDESLILNHVVKIEPDLNSGTEDVAMPKLEKEVELPCEKNGDLNKEEKMAEEIVEDLCPNNEYLISKSEIRDELIKEKQMNQIPPETNNEIFIPSETLHVPVETSLKENLVSYLSPEENAETKTVEFDTVNSESSEVNFTPDQKEVAVVNNLVIGNTEDKTLIKTQPVSKDQFSETKEDNGFVADDKKGVENDKLITAEEKTENSRIDELNHMEDNSLCDKGDKGTDISDVNDEPLKESLEFEVSARTDYSMEDSHEINDDLIDSNIEIKVESSIDADSTSDVKPSLDDSFPDFSLSLPDDLDLDSSLSDEHDDRDRIIEEESDHAMPDSTGENKFEAPKTEDMLSFPPCSESCENEKLQSDVAHTTPDKSEISDSLEKHDESESLDEALTSDIDKKDVLPEEKRDAERPEDVLSDILDKDKSTDAKYEELTSEQRQMKESVLHALGLKSLTPQQPEEKPKKDGYTGTLKAVIKLNRTGDKKRMVYRRSEDIMGELEYRICSEIPATDGVPITHLNDIAGIRKNVSKLHHDSESNNTSCGSLTSNGHSIDHEDNNQDESKPGSGKDLIIPEKSSSFSIHPGRLCSDVCSYCFGKFGCLDTPCHVAQLKSERQKKILENEPHLTAESCLCDACYRYVDRKANCPSKSGTTAGTSGGKTKVRPPASSQCCVNHCSMQATHTVKKKWLVKLKKSITNKVQSDKLDIDLDRSASMYFPLCAQHHYWVDYFTVCGICRKRLNRNHLYSLGSETDRLNLMLAEDGIPARLSDKLFLCKLCRYYSNLRLKYADPSAIPSSGRIFYRGYRRKILMSLDIPVSDSDEEPIKEDKKKVLKKPATEGNPSTNTAGTSTKSEENVMSLSNLATLLGDQPEQQARIQVKFGNVNIGRLSNLNIGQGGREERSSYSDVGLQANLEFEGPAVPDGSWERCVSTIQFDKRTKKLWHDLQKPYGNQSSFLRHLVMLEKYWRAGYLSLTQGADERAAKYLNGVKNRIKAFEGNLEKNPTPTPTSTPTSTPDATTPTSTSSGIDKFPLISNNGEIEVTPLKVPQKKASPPVVVEKKQMTALDRAKSLVRMIHQPPQRFPAPIQQRYPVPMYFPYSYPPAQQHHHHQPQRPPPLLKIRSKSIPQAYYTPIPTLTVTQNLKPILPKLPKALTVTQVPHVGPAITLNRSGITIEKQSGSLVMPALPIEKPSISVFREPAPGPP